MNGSDRSAFIPCRLSVPDRTIEAQVVWARANSLVVAFDKGENPPQPGSALADAALDLGGNWVNLGSCRFEPEENLPRRRRGDPTPESPIGRVVFKERVYDFSGLLQRRAISDLQQRVNASLVRALLVPATMRLLGEWNWWAPAWVRRVVRGGAGHVSH